jgi:hypothetical protein
MYKCRGVSSITATRPPRAGGVAARSMLSGEPDIACKNCVFFKGPCPHVRASGRVCGSSQRRQSYMVPHQAQNLSVGKLRGNQFWPRGPSEWCLKPRQQTQKSKGWRSGMEGDLPRGTATCRDGAGMRSHPRRCPQRPRASSGKESREMPLCMYV